MLMDAPSLAQYQQMQNQNSMYSSSQIIGMPNPNSFPSNNTTNVFNIIIQPNSMIPQMQPQMPSMFQGQMIGGQGMPTIMQGQSIGGFPQMPMPQPSFGLDQVMGLLMGMMQMMMGGGFPVLANGQQEIIQEEVIIGDTRAWGDPHYVFEDKTGKDVTIDHKGTDGETYNVLNADGLDIDAEYKHHGGNKPQDIGAVRIDAGNQELILNRGKATLDGQELKEGEHTLADGRTINVNNGNVDISTINGDGTISVKKDGGRYDISTSGKVGVNTNIDNGGILGFLATQGQNNSKDEILKEWDTSGNGILDNDDAKIVNMFRTQDDIGIYQY